MCAVAATAHAADPAPIDPVQGYSFEAGTRGWSASGGALTAVRRADAPDGGSVARLRRNASLARSLAVTRPRVAIAPRTATGYVIGAWLRADARSSAGDRAVLRVVQRARSGKVVKRWTSAPLTLGRTFRPARVALTTAPGGGQLDVTVVHQLAKAGDASLVDALTVARRTSSGVPSPTSTRTRHSAPM